MTGSHTFYLKSELQNELVSRIRELIRSRDQLTSGRVREAVLSRAIGVSRTPIRAALRHLVGEGILRTHAQGGYAVLQTPSLVPERITGREPASSIYGRMLRDIVLNEMPDPASEKALMRKYEVGRGEIIRVLRRLVREGLAEPMPGRGWSMLKFDSERMSRSYHLRYILEPAMVLDRNYAVDFAALKRLRADHDGALASLSPKSPWHELFELDAVFHETLARGSGNDLIVDIIRRQNNLRRLSEFFGYSRLERVRASMNEHVAIITALFSNNMTGASELLRRHLTISQMATEENFTRDLETVRSASSGLEWLR